MPREYHIDIHRTARYFTLGNGADPDEIWLVLHGYGQLAERFLARFETLDDGRRLIVAPEGLSRFYTDEMRKHEKVGASWMTREDRLAEIEDYVAYLDKVHAEVRTGPGAAAARLVVLGFSQGSATAARWALRGTARVDRLVLWAGTLPPDIDLRATAARLSAMDLTIVAGEHDDWVQSNLALQEEAMAEAGVRYRLVEFAGGHSIEAEVLKRLTGR